MVDDKRDAVPQTTTSYLVDMSCYKDLGPGHDQSIVLVPGENQVTVNAGVREDELDAFLTKNNFMLKTVTAGGFFSLGGMTAVDVHGGREFSGCSTVVFLYYYVRLNSDSLARRRRHPLKTSWPLPWPCATRRCPQGEVEDVCS